MGDKATCCCPSAQPLPSASHLPALLWPAQLSLGFYSRYPISRRVLVIHAVWCVSESAAKIRRPSYSTGALSFLPMRAVEISEPLQRTLESAACLSQKVTTPIYVMLQTDISTKPTLSEAEYVLFHLFLVLGKIMQDLTIPLVFSNLSYPPTLYPLIV